MCHATLWAGLERQIHTPTAAALFQSTQTRHRALAGYESLHAAVHARRASSEAAGDAVLTALLVEYAHSRHPVWAAALALSMRGALGALAQKIERSAESDSTSIVLLAFLEVAARFHTTHRRLGLRLYSETRRRVVRSVIGECRQTRAAQPRRRRRHRSRRPRSARVRDRPRPGAFRAVARLEGSAPGRVGRRVHRAPEGAGPPPICPRASWRARPSPPPKPRRTSRRARPRRVIPTPPTENKEHP